MPPRRGPVAIPSRRVADADDLSGRIAAEKPSGEDLQRKVIEAVRRHQPKATLIEDHASGTALQQALKQQRFKTIAIKPKGDKVMRMHAHTAALEGGKVLLQKDAPWLDDFRYEVLAFPKGKHDDQVDALSQLMTWAEDRQIPKCRVQHLAWATRS